MLGPRSLTQLCLASLLLTITANPAQSPGENSAAGSKTEVLPSAAHLSFEVVSIRPSEPETLFSFHRTPDGFQGTGMTLDTVILLAYFPFALWSHDRIQNGPGWVAHNRYDITAKVAPENLASWTQQSVGEPTAMRAMLYSMLVDRCHLQLHTTPADMPGFALAVSHRGPSLHAASATEDLSDPKAMKLTDGGIAVGENLPDRTTTWHFYDAPMASLTDFLSHVAHTRILDETGLKGRYDFALAMVPDRPRSGYGEITDPSDFWDLRALGLRTISKKVPTITLVIDHLDPPSAN